jgi:hypothetical protein
MTKTNQKAMSVVLNGNIFCAHHEEINWKDGNELFEFLNDGWEIVEPKSKFYHIRLPYLGMFMCHLEKLMTLEYSLGEWFQKSCNTNKLDFIFQEELLKLVYIHSTKDDHVCVFWNTEQYKFVKLNHIACPELCENIDKWKDVMYKMALNSLYPLDNNSATLRRLINFIEEK